LYETTKNKIAIGNVAEIPVCIVGLLVFEAFTELSSCLFSFLYASRCNPLIKSQKIIGIVMFILGSLHIKGLSKLKWDSFGKKLG